jgi:predicted DNA-binding transcriptional regulator AlpA
MTSFQGRDGARREFLSERDVAAMGLASVRTLQTWRLLNRGPKFYRVGRAVRYRINDIEAWLKTRAITPAGAEFTK